ncbi:MAG: peptidase-C39 like family protein [Flavobacteriales bacterium]|nr:hypothetical protein [Flavobacteriales bacterium]MCB9167932.1 peptidase-C39 like family protein [Flavobacteriales bacterium]
MRPIRILPQPDDSTCGPTALHAVYGYLGLDLSLDRVIREVHHLEDGGTLAVYLGLHALKNGFQARIHSYNLRVFDPSWDGIPTEELRAKLLAQLRVKDGKKLRTASLAYSRFLKLGGEIRFDDPTPALFRGYFQAGLPVLAGLSATYLYRSRRERTNDRGQSVFDDLKGRPMGHFVVLGGMDGDQVLIADPYRDNPYSADHRYQVHVGRLINSIMLGIVTYDANILVISRGTSLP